jgi:hypothetical protein
MPIAVERINARWFEKLSAHLLHIQCESGDWLLISCVSGTVVASIELGNSGENAMNRDQIVEEVMEFVGGVFRLCAILAVAFPMAVGFLYLIKAMQ